MVNRSVFLVFIAAIGALLIASHAIANILANVGQIGLMHANEHEGAISFDLLSSIDEKIDSDLTRATTFFAHSLEYDATNRTARRGLARIYTAKNNLELAVDLFEDLESDAKQSDPILFLDLLYVYRMAGNYAGIIRLADTRFESVVTPRPLREQELHDIFALAYLEQAVETLNTNTPNRSEQYLEKALEWRPGDLYATFRLWERSREIHDSSKTEALEKALRQFPIEAISPTDEQLAEYAFSVVPDLISNELWSTEQAKTVVSFLVAKGILRDQLQGLLGSLIDQYPSDADWLLYLAELHHRAGQLIEAQRLYRQALKLAPDDPQLLIRLGLIAELDWRNDYSNTSAFRNAVDYYSWSLTIQPEDVFSRGRLKTICHEIEEHSIVAEHLQTEMTACSLLIPTGNISVVEDSAATVSRVLGVPEDSFVLGPNLIDDEGFESWNSQQLENWTLTLWIGNEYNDALFQVQQDSLDAFQGESAARIDGLWVGSDKARRAAYTALQPLSVDLRQAKPIVLDRTGLYLISFAYRTVNTIGERVASIWFTSEPNVLFADSRFVPATDGEWREVIVIAKNSVGNAWVRPSLVSWSEGTVFYDNFQIRELTIQDDYVPSHEWPLIISLQTDVRD